MKLIKKILKNIKYLGLLINYKLFSSEKNKGYNNLTLNKSIIKKTIMFSKLKSINEYDINWQRTVKFLEFIKKKN